MKDPLDACPSALARLPHGPEFRFLDRLLSLDPGGEGTGEYDLPEKASFLAGHFPGDPMMPGVLLIEAVAQLAGVVAQSDPAITPLPALRLAAIRNARLHGAVKPGQTVWLKATVTGRLGNLVQATTEARIAGELVLSADIVLGSPQA